MKLKRVRRAAVVVAVLSAVGVVAATAGASTGATGDGGSTAPSNIGASTNISGPSGSTDASGGIGSTGTSGASGLSGTGGVSGPSGPTGASAPSAPAGTTGASGTAGTPPAGDVTPPSDTTGPTGVTGATGPTGPTVFFPTGTTGGATTKHRHRHRHHKGSGGPSIAVGETQPLSATGAGKHHHGGGAGDGQANGPTAPPPSLFDGVNPLAGVLPGSWEDPFIVAGAADVPQFYVQSFHVPAFLLSIYQAAGAAYDIPWQTLAAINEVETDYGTNLDVSSAGAIGWMQFLPSTWKRYGVDASASGSRDPYNAADAIFSAARYLAAAGGARNLPRAIFAYNHSHAYVQSVLDRAELLSGEPAALIGSVSELGEGDFPIQLRYGASYRSAGKTAADAAAPTAGGGTAPAPGAVGAAAAASVRQAPGADIFAASGAAVVAAQDGTVVAIGRNHKLGRYIVVRNAFGDRFTYANLASVSPWYPIPRAPARSQQILSAAVPSALAPGPRPTNAPASAGAQHSGKSPTKIFSTQRHQARHASSAHVSAVVATINLASSPTPATLFTPLAVLERAQRTPVHTRTIRRAALLDRYFTGAFGLRPSQLEIAPLRVHSRVLAGTILGRLARTDGKREPHLLFQLRPAGTGQPLIDPRPFLDAWSQLETLELHRNSFASSPYYGPNLHARNVGALLLMSQVDIERVVLEDRRVNLPACESAAIAAGNVDRRVLATIEVLVLHGIDPTLSGAWCSSNAHTRHATASVLKTGNAVELTTLDGRPATGAVARVAIDALAGLHGSARPALSEATAPGALVIAFKPAPQPQALAVAASFTAGFALSAARWSQLDARLGQIAQPRIPTAVSSAALPVRSARKAPRRAAH